MKSVFEEIFGSKAKSRTLMFLLEHPICEYTKGDLKEETGLSRVSVNRAMEVLLKYKIVVPTRKVSTAEFYQINMDSPITKSLLELIKKINEVLL